MSARSAGPSPASFTQLGYEVAVSNSRGPETLKDLQNELGSHARALSVADTAEYADIVVVSIPLDCLPRRAEGGPRGQGRHRHLQLLPAARRSLPGAGRRLDDVERAAGRPAAELARRQGVQRHQVAVRSPSWPDPPATPARVAIPIAGDSASAKQTVASLIDELGFDAVDTGDLGSAGSFSPELSCTAPTPPPTRSAPPWADPTRS